MSRAFSRFGLALVAFCGIATGYATFQPELEKQRAERTGEFQGQHPSQDDEALSKAIASDLKEAKEQLEPEGSKGIAWGIREAIWGKPGVKNIEGSADVKEVKG